MNNSLERLVGGIIATLRSDIIPNVTDDYARGQAIGVIDLLNNIAPRLEWERAPLLRALESRHALIADVEQLLGGNTVTSLSATEMAAQSSHELLAERDRLDVAICELVARVFALGETEQVRDARRRLLQHMHDDVTEEMKLTRKPLFAEIATGRSAE